MFHISFLLVNVLHLLFVREMCCLKIAAASSALSANFFNGFDLFKVKLLH